MPLIFLAYLTVLLYFCIFSNNIIIGCIFLLSLGIAFWRKFYVLFPLLLIFGIYFYLFNAYHSQKMALPEVAFHQITPRIDTLQVNGDLLSFRGRVHDRDYQAYATLQSKKEQTYFKNLAQNCRISFTGNLEKPAAQRNFEGFDEQKYYSNQNIYRQIKIRQINAVKLTHNFNIWLLRRKGIVWAQSHFPRPMSSYMTGLLFGYLGKDFSQMTTIYSALGIIHLFALSGMQVNFFVEVLRKILLKIGIRLEFIPFFKFLFSIFYAILTGFSLSVLRALFQKNIPAKGLDNMAITTVGLLLVYPGFLLNKGGQLTLLYAFTISMLQQFSFTKSNIREALFKTLALNLIAFPLLIFDFFSFQPLSIILTIGFGLIFDKIMLPLLLITFLLSLTGLSVNLNILFLLLEKMMRHLYQWFSYTPVFGKPSLIGLLGLFLTAGLLVDALRKKKLRFFCAFSLLLILFFVKHPVAPTITMIDVGQGDSILLQDRWNQETVLIDTGGRLTLPQPKWKKAHISTNADNTLIPYLKAEGISTLDHLILTHTDADHVGDFLTLARTIKIRDVWVSPGELTVPTFVHQLKRAQLPIHIVKNGHKLPIFNGQLEILSNGYTHKGDNDDSIVTYGDFFNKKFLFTGDLEQEGELKLLKAYPRLKVDVLKVGHHGSKTSSNPYFIRQIDPQLALISVGKKNRYGHPNQETLATLKKAQIKILRTDQVGAVQLIYHHQKWQVKTVR